MHFQSSHTVDNSEAIASERARFDRLLGREAGRVRRNPAKLRGAVQRMGAVLAAQPGLDAFDRQAAEIVVKETLGVAMLAGRIAAGDGRSVDAAIASGTLDAHLSAESRDYLRRLTKAPPGRPS